MSFAIPSACTQLNTFINDELSFAYNIISNILDFDQVDEGMLVAHGVCDELDELKLTYQVSASVDQL